MHMSSSLLLEPPNLISASHGAERDDHSGVFILANGPPSGSNGKATIILDYGRCVDGVPTFAVDLAHGNMPIEVKVFYSKTADGFNCEEEGDGPFFCFSNAMDCYRCVSMQIPPSASPQTLTSALAQRSQRYLKLVLVSANASIVISRIGLHTSRSSLTQKAFFHCSDEALNRIWSDGVNTLDMCTITKGEPTPLWEVTGQGTRVLGRRWAPCQQGIRWGDTESSFQVFVEQRGASWGVLMVANGVIFCLDIEAEELRAYEGLTHDSAVFPVKCFGSWSTHALVNNNDWISISTITSGNCITVKINDREVASITDIQIRPVLGGSSSNTSCIAFGSPQGWLSLYRNLLVKDVHGKILYENDLLSSNENRTLDDFRVGPCMIDGAKPSQTTFGLSDLFVSGRGVAYSGLDMEAVLGRIELFSSHQTSNDYVGSLCPAEAPVHLGNEVPTKHAYYSMTYALLLVVAIKDYWLHSGDDDARSQCLPAAERLLRFAESHEKPSGLIELPPSMSMHWYPLDGPVFGASGTTNLAYYNALSAVRAMTHNGYRKFQISAKMGILEKGILAHLWNSEEGSVCMGTTLPDDEICQDANGYAVALDMDQDSDACLSQSTGSPEPTPIAFKSLQHSDRTGVVDPYATGFAAEALFTHQRGQDAIRLIENSWGPMTGISNYNHSGGQWKAMTTKGKPITQDTSLMHAWSSWPVFLLPQYVVGVKPLEPEWRNIQVAPVLCDINYAQYHIETPQGWLEIEINSDEAGGVLCVKATLPSGMKAHIVAPHGYFSDNSGILKGPLDNAVVELIRL